jgi:hypothetical protein
VNSNKNKLTPLPTEKKKRKVSGVFTSVCDFCVDMVKFVYFATSVAGGYVLVTQGSLSMRVVGGILLTGGVAFFADKTVRK